MEQQRENDQVDFWLVQYQRLLDSKPQVLLQKVRITMQVFPSISKRFKCGIFKIKCNWTKKLLGPKSHLLHHFVPMVLFLINSLTDC